MKVPDHVSGLILFLVSGAALVAAWRFPPAIGQPLGPAVFPTVISAALAVSSLLLIGSSVRRRLQSSGEAAPAANAEAPVGLASLGLMGLVVLMPVLYILVVETLGFLLTSFLILFATTLALWRGLLRSALFSLGSVVAIDALFRGVFRIPFEPGVLQIPWW